MASGCPRVSVIAEFYCAPRCISAGWKTNIPPPRASKSQDVRDWLDLYAVREFLDSWQNAEHSGDVPAHSQTATTGHGAVASASHWGRPDIAFTLRPQLKRHCEYLSPARPELILRDLFLPDMDGREVLKCLREWTSTPIVVMSVRHEESEKIACLDAGADDYLTKPFTMGEFLARLRARAPVSTAERGTDPCACLTRPGPCSCEGAGAVAYSRSRSS